MSAGNDEDVKFNREEEIKKITSYPPIYIFKHRPELVNYDRNAPDPTSTFTWNMNVLDIMEQYHLTELRVLLSKIGDNATVRH